uniref:SCP domain-containing protein n=1 Tax=Anopheles atroparvus TaxID=41427 RepID=A0AAG5DK18_ANOAO
MTRRTQLTAETMLTVVVLVAMAPACLGQLARYCNLNLCPAGDAHLGCTATAGFGSACYNRQPVQVAMTPGRKAAILEQHNRQREQIASGLLPGYLSAYRMPQLYWDDELQLLAEANARSCVYAHDHCRNTPSFPKAGQNIAIIRHFGLNLTKDGVIRYIIDHWFNEYPLAVNFVDRYPDGYTGPDFAHFTQIVNDRATRMACGMASWHTVQNGYTWTHDYLVCNYGHSNVIGDRSYTKGAPGAGCQSPRSQRYANLCQFT